MSITINNLINQFINTLDTVNSKKNYTSSLNTFKKYLNEEYSIDTNVETIEVVKTSMIKTYNNYLKEKYKANTVNTKIATLGSFYKFLVNDDIIKKNSFEIANISKMDTSTAIDNDKYLNTREIKKLLNHMENLQRTSKKQRCFEFKKARDKFLIGLMLNTGLRITEATSIKLQDISIDVDPDTNEEIISIYIDKTKNKKSHIVSLNKKVKEYYYEWLVEREKRLEYKREESEYLVITINCNPGHTDVKNITNGIKKYCRDAKVKELTAHKLRHSAGTYMLNHGATVKEVQVALNHKSIETTSNFYLHIDNKHLRECQDF